MDAAAVGDYLAKSLGRPGLRVDKLNRIPGGASRATWSVDVSWNGGSDGLIVRMDPDASLLESNRRVEYEIYRALAGHDVIPVPEALLIEDDPQALGHTFFVMRRVPGASGGIAQDARPVIADQKMRILGAISNSDWRALGLNAVFEEPSPADCALRELAMWERVLDDNDLGPLPITRSAVRRLRREPPPPPERVCLVHADYRTGNFLHDGRSITAILDWEMAHLGDPLEDIAWTFTRNWRSGRPDLVGGLLPEDEAIGVWERSSGLRADRDALAWWSLFSHVKANAIWVTGAFEYAKGRTTEPLLAIIPWIFVNRQEGWMLDEMGVPA